MFLFICIVDLLCGCGDIEANPGPKYSSLTFVHWNLNCLTAHGSWLKSHYFKPTFSSKIITSYVYRKRLWILPLKGMMIWSQLMNTT